MTQQKRPESLNMHAVIYRGFVYPEKEQEYIEAWQKIALYFIKHRGAIGSALHKQIKENILPIHVGPIKKFVIHHGSHLGISIFLLKLMK